MVREVQTRPSAAPDEQLRKALRRIAGADLLTTRYLSLRLHLWALAQADEDYAQMLQALIATLKKPS